MRTSVDPKKLEELSAGSNQLCKSIEAVERNIHQSISRLIRETNSQYPEPYVQNAADRVEESLVEIRKLVESVIKELDKKAKVLTQAAERYRKDEQTAKRKLQQSVKPSSFYTNDGRITGEGHTSYLQDELFKDPAVQKLHEQALNGTDEEKKLAKEKLDAIFQARNTIARAQVAYSVYKTFGNTYAMERAHIEATRQRNILKKYGVSEDLYDEKVNLSQNYTGPTLLACSYDPSMIITKDGKSLQVLMPEDNQYQYLLGLVMKGEGQGAWAKKQLDEIHKLLGEIGRSQVAWHEYKAKDMKKEMDGAHLYAEKLREALKDKYSLSSAMVDDVDYKHLWTGTGDAGNYLKPKETGGLDRSGNPNLYKIDKYKHSRDLALEINQINEVKFGKQLQNFAKIYEKNREVYERISQKTGIPPQLIAALHYRESSGNFNTYLHNGQKLGQVTTIVPKGIYFDNFEDAAVHALLQKKGLRDAYGLKAQSNDLVAMLTFAEAYNGWGYYNRDRVSPYVYSGTNVYKKGKYVADGKFDPETIDKQPGIYILINAITPVSNSTIPSENPPKVDNKPTNNKTSFEANVKSAQNVLDEKSNLQKGAVTIPNLQNFPLYVQGDARYGKELIGNDTMAAIGCTTTALAAVNAWKTYGEWKDGEEPHPGRYNNTVEYTSSGNIYWDSAEVTIPNKKTFNYGDSKFEGIVKAAIDKGKPVIFAVNGGEHWMIAVGYDSEGTVIVYDPANGSLSTTEEINKLRSSKGKHLYKTIDRYGVM
jgi:lysozyme family protein